MTALAVALAFFVGVALGLLGGGGSILAVPLLVYVAGLDTHEAVTVSLLVVGVTSLVGMASHGRARARALGGRERSSRQGACPLPTSGGGSAARSRRSCSCWRSPR